MWLAVTSTWYIHPIAQALKDGFALVPLSIAEYTGLEILVGIVEVSSVALKHVFETGP